MATTEVVKDDIIVADAIVPKDVVNKLIAAQYVNFSSLLMKDVTDAEQSLKWKAGHLKVNDQVGPPISDYNLWIEAMLNFEHILTSFVANPSLYGKLAAYRRHIHKLQIKFKWEKVYEYDKKFQKACHIHNR